jgi:DNA polymerase I-like protein with 3'-5' exonuclease and polymerase domains
MCNFLPPSGVHDLQHENKNMKIRLFTDLKIDHLLPPQDDLNLNYTLERVDKSFVTDYFSTANGMAFDIETTGLHPEHSDQFDMEDEEDIFTSHSPINEGEEPDTITLIQCYNTKLGTLIFGPDKVLECIHLLHEYTPTLLLHHARFDLNWLMSLGFDITTCKFEDTYLLYKCTYNGTLPAKVNTSGYTNARLDTLLKIFLKLEMSKSERINFVGKKFHQLTPAMLHYAALDVQYLPALMEALLGANDLRPPTATTDGYDFEREVVKSLLTVTHNGMPVDKDKWVATLDMLEAKILTQHDELYAFLESTGFLRTPEYLDSLSRKDLRRWQKEGCPIYIPLNDNHLKGYMRRNNIRITSTSEPNKLTLDREEVKRYMTRVSPSDPHFPFLKLLREYKDTKSALEKSKKLVTFIKNGRVHPTFNTPLNTFRISAKDPNTQQITKSFDFRSCISVGEGRRLLTADYSAQEIAVFAFLANETSLLDNYMARADLHALNGQVLYHTKEPDGKEVVDKYSPLFPNTNTTYRDVAKIAVFKMNYGGTPMSFASDLNIELSESEHIFNTLLNKYPSQVQLILDNLRAAVQSQFCITLFSPLNMYYYDYVLRDFAQSMKSQYPRMRLQIDKKNLKITTLYHYKEQHKDYYDNANGEDKEAYFWTLKDKLRSLNKALGSFSRKVRNYPIQCMSAVITKKAVMLINEHIQQNNLDAKVVNVIHDEVVVECEESIAPQLALDVERLMEEASKMYMSDTYYCLVQVKEDSVWSK